MNLNAHPPTEQSPTALTLSLGPANRYNTLARSQVPCESLRAFESSLYTRVEVEEEEDTSISIERLVLGRICSSSIDCFCSIRCSASVSHAADGREDASASQQWLIRATTASHPSVDRFECDWPTPPSVAST